MNTDWTFPQVSKAAGFDTRRIPYPTMEEADALYARVEEADFEAAVRVAQLYRGLPSPKDNHERAILEVLIRAFGIVGRRR